MRGRENVRYDHWIGGAALAPGAGRYMPVVDPATRRPNGEVARGDAVDVDLAAGAAEQARHIWAASSTDERASMMNAIGEAIDANAAELIELERACTGKVEVQAKSEVAMSAAYFRYYAGALRSFGGRTIDLGSASHTFTALEPYGVVGVITPWNYPLNQSCRAVAPALAAGNAVVVKPSEVTPTSTLALARIASQSGLAPGLLNVVAGLGDEVGQALVAHPVIRKVAFTGSVATGRQLARAAADRLIPLTLELGGKSPLIVFADADLERAAAAAVKMLATNAGQVCSATTRLLVAESVHDELLALVVAGAQRLQPGKDFGPMITEGQYRKVIDCFQQAQSAGLVPLAGGREYQTGAAAQGWYLQPTVYTHVPRTSSLAREEIFGPVLVGLTFSDELSAISIANDTDYGLVASIWSRDLSRALRVAGQLDAGQVTINGGPLGIETPFGGTKLSGYGREKGLEALAEYAQSKTISIGLG